ncbi:hypothetical protein BDV12DRAFT_189960 [Aspergillus spectabilis]
MQPPSPEVEPVAIVGLACRLPGGANTPSKLWDLAHSGRQCWQDVPSSRYNWKAFHHPDPEAKGTHNARGGFFLNEDISAFDANFFGIPVAEANAIDPQQRLLLEVSYEALENAGLPLENLRGSRTGVYVALVSRDYDRQVYKDPYLIPKHHLTGCGDATACGRISYAFDLRGPCMSLDTGCSGGMVALHLACQALRLGETDAAIVGGTNLLLAPDMTIAMSALRMVNDNGRCYPFDSRGAGYGRAEGVAAVILKRLKDALRDGDNVRAVIRNTGVNQDGKTNGILLPSSEAQGELTAALYRQAGLNPQDVCYVEAHGTGTQAGDVAEVNSIKHVFVDVKAHRDHPLFLGSIKANLGHSESTSGLAGVIKTVMALEKAVIPPVAALETVKPSLDNMLGSGDIIIPRKPQPWPHQGPRLASVNSFGFGGTNAHVILESAPGGATTRDGLITPPTDKNAEPQLFVVSAKSKASLQGIIQDLKHWITTHGTIGTTKKELAKTLSSRRSRFNWRSSFVASSFTSLLSALEGPRLTKASPNKRVVFLFTGQGAQYHGMGRELLRLQTDFAKSLHRSQDILTGLGASWRLVDELLCEESMSRINTSELSQPATTAIQIALVDLLAELGVQPAMVLGHSSGEVAAAYAAGILGHREALTVSYHKGFVAGWCKEAVPFKGAMLAVGLGEPNVLPYVRQQRGRLGKCVVACVNSPSSVTLSGDETAIAEMQELLNKESVFNRRLRVDIAYHSHHMQAVSERFLQSISGVVAKPPQSSIRYFSSVTGSESTSPLGPMYWVDNLVSQVCFAPALEGLTRLHYESNPDSNLVLLEIGPHGALQGPIRQNMISATIKWSYTPTLVRNKDAHEAALEMVGGLFENGVQLDLTTNLSQQNNGQEISIAADLPSYSWDHSNNYWHESRLSREYRFREHPPHDLLGLRLNGTSTIEPVFRHILSVDDHPWLQEHIIDGFALYPGSAFLCMAIEALRQVSKDRGEKHEIAKYIFHEVSFSKALVVPDSPDSIEVLISLKPSHASKERLGISWEEFRVTSVAGDGKWSEHCRGSIRAEYRSMVAGENSMRRNGIDYGDTFAIIRALHLGDRQALGRLQVPDIRPLMPSQHMQPHVIHPAVFDAFMHIVLPLYHRHCSQGPVMLVSVGEVSISADMLNEPGNELLVACRLTEAGRRQGSVEVSVMQEDSQGHLVEHRHIYRHGSLLVPRLAPNIMANQWLDARINGKGIKESASFHGLLDSAVFLPIEDSPAALGPEEVLVKVYAHAGRGKATDCMMGEFSGEILAVGDRVCGWGSMPYTNIARVFAHRAASIPIAFQTAAHALFSIARLEKAQSILIHGAAGAYLSADVYATVGSSEKQRLLTRTKNIPKSRIFSSLSTSFKDSILRLTDKKGVDVVLNCSSGDLLGESMASKRPLTLDTHLGRNITFATVDMQLLATKRPTKLQDTFAKVMGLYREGMLKPIAPITTILGQSQQYSGKIVLEADEQASVKQIAPRPEPIRLSSSGTYVVLGGSEDINNALRLFLRDHGAENIINVVSAGLQREENSYDDSPLERLEQCRRPGPTLERHSRISPPSSLSPSARQTPS